MYYYIGIVWQKIIVDPVRCSGRWLVFVVFFSVPVAVSDAADFGAAVPVAPSGNVISQLSNPAISPSTVTAPTAATTATATQLWNLHDIDIHTLIDDVAAATGKNFVVDNRVQAKVTVVSSHPLQADEIYPVFLTILQVYGFAAVPSGNIIKIVPSAAATQSNLPLINHTVSGDQVVVRVVALKNNSADQLVPILRPLLPPSSNISVYQPTNTLILAGTASSVQSMVDLITNLDSVNNKNIEIVSLHYSNATDVVKEISALLSNNNMVNSNVTLSADNASNSVLIRGNSTQRQMLRGLIRELDRRTNVTNNNNTHVFNLHYLQAKELVPILAGIIGKDSSANDNNVAGAMTAPAIPPSAAPMAMVGGSNSPGSGPMPDGNTSMVSNPYEPPPINNTPVTATVTADNQTIHIEAEPNTNAVIVTAPRDIMQTVAKVIAQLDTRPLQVLVEAAIVEIDESKLKNLGVDWGTVQVSGDTASSIATDTAFSALTGGLGIGFIHSGSIKIMVSALARDGSTNILSTPTIIVMNNQRADIKVGQNVPFVTGTYSTSSAGSLDNPYTTTQREYVGLELKVTPQISPNGTVRLVLNQGNESIADGDNNSTNPTTDTSLINTSVMVNSGEILVLGGLMSNQMTAVTRKVPILGDLPGIGRLFQSKEHTLEKKNLVVFLRPVILRSGLDGQRMSAKKYKKIRRLQIKKYAESQRDPIDREYKPAVLPPLPSKQKKSAGFEPVEQNEKPVVLIPAQGEWRK